MKMKYLVVMLALSFSWPAQAQSFAQWAAKEKKSGDKAWNQGKALSAKNHWLKALMYLKWGASSRWDLMAELKQQIVLSQAKLPPSVPKKENKPKKIKSQRTEKDVFNVQDKVKGGPLIQKAVQAKVNGQLDLAMHFYQLALKANPNSTLAKEGLNQVGQEMD